MQKKKKREEKKRRKKEKKKREEKKEKKKREEKKRIEARKIRWKTQNWIKNYAKSTVETIPYAHCKGKDNVYPYS